MYKIVEMSIPEFLNKKYFDWQAKERRRVTVEEFGSLFGASKSLMTMWMNGTRSPGTEYKKRIIEQYGEEAIIAFGEDPDLYAVTENWKLLDPESRKSYREQIEKKALENDIKRTSTKRRTRTIE